jgi:citrate lyase beta subunit
VGQVARVVAALGDASDALAGFVIPKFLPDETGRCALEAVRSASEHLGRRLWVMPVLEAPAIAHLETRVSVLRDIHVLLTEFQDDVLAVRIGATDLASVHALRRNRELTVYDMRVVADAITDIVNVLGRADSTGFVITGPVWEHFSTERIFKPQLRTTPFLDHGESDLRSVLIARDLDALIREVVLDRANGLTGKTVIHPSHVAPVHALSIVTHEEWSDAVDIIRAVDGGALASDYGNKMNEALPHRAWAEQTLLRAQVFGVARQDASFVEILGVVLRQR